MAKMGWTEGTGLGKKRDGIASHIKVRKREENIGLGVEKERTRQAGVEGMWWSSSVSDTLMKLRQKSKNSKGHKKSKKRLKSGNGDNIEEKPKIYTDEELFIATGGARFGMRAHRRAEGKWQRTENSEELKNWEQKTKNQAEWNGLGKASVILSGNNSGRIEENSNNTNILKKRKRTDDKEEIVIHNDADGIDEARIGTLEHVKRNEDSSTLSAKKKDRKRRKKEKSEKKSKKSKKTKR